MAAMDRSLSHVSVFYEDHIYDLMRDIEEHVDILLKWIKEVKVELVRASRRALLFRGAAVAGTAAAAGVAHKTGLIGKALNYFFGKEEKAPTKQTKSKKEPKKYFVIKK